MSLRSPYCSQIKESKISLRELRVNTPPIRVFYAFDPERQAILLVGADKSGSKDKKFYMDCIALAENRWKEYLASK